MSKRLIGETILGGILMIESLAKRHMADQNVHLCMTVNEAVLSFLYLFQKPITRSDGIVLVPEIEILSRYLPGVDQLNDFHELKKIIPLVGAKTLSSLIKNNLKKIKKIITISDQFLHIAPSELMISAFIRPRELMHVPRSSVDAEIDRIVAEPEVDPTEEIDAYIADFIEKCQQ